MRFASRALALLLLLAASGCTIGRWYVGSPLHSDPRQVLVVGETPKAEVLAKLGPPDRILRLAKGDVFVYHHDQRNSSEFELREPLVTRLTLFQWEKVQDKSDRLMVFFDPGGVVSAFGYRQGRGELQPF
jgi:hypothetical protein